MTLGTGGRGPQARSVLQGPAVFWCGEGAVCGAFGGWKTAQAASFLVGSESDVRHWGPWPASPVRPSGPCCFGVAKAPFVKLGGWGRGPAFCPSGFCCWVKPPFVISSTRAIGRCDTAFRWACDALFEFGRKLLLNAPPCRMLDMCAHVCDLQAGHSQREKICRSHHRGGDRPALSSPCFAQIGTVRAKVCVHSRRSCVGPRSKLLGR